MKHKWTHKDELACLIIFKQAEEKDFSHGVVAKLVREFRDKEKKHRLPPEKSMNAKIGNFKSVAGINEDSNFSQPNKIMYDKHKDCSIAELEEIYSEAKPTDNLLLD